MTDIQGASANVGGDPRDAWIDLSLNKPGQRVRARQHELKQSAQERGLLWRMFIGCAQQRPWRFGAEGDEEVARRLRKLPEGWHVLHAVPVGERGSDIDHVIIGPGGVFTVNTKNHSRGKVWVGQNSFLVNGQCTDHLRNARHEAQRATKLLSGACSFTVNVTPIIVVMASSLKVKAKPEGVEVVPRVQIGRWLSQRPNVLSHRDVERIFDIARRDTTWRLRGPRPPVIDLRE